MKDLSRYYTLLRDPARRRIIEILGEQEKIGFKELRETLNLGVGTVYYHLDMLSDFLTQDKERKYRLSDKGKMLYKFLKEGSAPASLQMGEALSHRVARWIFLSPLFAKTSKPLRLLPIAAAIVLAGALGSAYAKLEPALFFYFPYSPHSFANIVFLFVLNWVGLFLFAELFTFLVYRRIGNELQFLTCLGLATLPIAAFPYLYLVAGALFSQYLLFALQIWGLLLFSASLCFGKGLRLDKAVITGLTAIYLNTLILFMLGWFA